MQSMSVRQGIAAACLFLVFGAVAAYVDYVQPTRATAGRSHEEARFERATEPAALKDRALALLTEGGTQSWPRR